MKFENAKIKILDLDLKGCLYLNHLSHSQRVALFFKTISRLGDGPFWYVMLLSVWATQGLAYGLQILYLILAGSVGTLIYKFLKHKTTRPRPYQVHQVIVLGERPLDHFSFPSGHTLHAVMVTIVLGYIQPVLLILMLPFTILIALSRMVLGLHYPSDVIVGAIIGASVASAVILLAPSLNIIL
ncbi:MULTISPECIES: phosphatase PAP2 family protein [Acinetobacter]|uniref:undecaprenyl-diphosphate phosphatase n=3 Tax=Acinetobacter haemolyticus TaxID=29430 RepID=A0A1L6KK48_ACIHA|nr:MULTISPECIES: phosphatase PAP2 family protein [Acinetobacter]APR69414.1 phosphatidylglycerophosphatase [Acinetobacter haemolyticus]ATZ68162.1 phosphatidylglycerophosphatase [Acinetobacter haemolyticus]AZN68156.1 phosphatase PAP2 family protein [Acinetobacter haemolyticus]EEH67209.1 PAP2 family protein [Acinetobacter sp. ATCC 27244]EFF81533.1 PAP2 family protein [Acinetobacter haemolyticus ATCC 19194]